MLNPDNVRFVCTRCGNCCTDKNTIVNVTYLDILRIMKGLKLTYDETSEIFGFYVYDKSLASIDLDKMVINPIETEKGPAFVGLMKNEQGVCFFYDQGKKKCLIYDLRPIFCKSFPFSFNISHNNIQTKKGEINIIYTEKARNYCPGIGNDAPLVDIEYLNELANHTLRDLKKNYKFNENWNKNASKKQIVATAKNFLKIIYKMREKET